MLINLIRYQLLIMVIALLYLPKLKFPYIYCREMWVKFTAEWILLIHLPETSFDNQGVFFIQNVCQNVLQSTQLPMEISQKFVKKNKVYPV